MTLPILGTATLSKDACKRLLLKRNPQAAVEVIDHYYELENSWGIRADVLVCQMFHETGYLTSWWSLPPRRNMAGIGVTGETSPTDPHSTAWAFHQEENKWEKGYSFPDWTTAAQVHMAHMSAYVYTDERNHASQIDPRYAAARSQFALKKWPPCHIMTDLNGKWAVPGPTYGQTIEQIYNAVASLPATSNS